MLTTLNYLTTLNLIIILINVIENDDCCLLLSKLCHRALRSSRVFLKMVHDVIFSSSRFMDVFLHPKSMECILLVTYDGYHYI